MKVTDTTKAPKYPTTTLNNIPQGQVFRGRILGHSGHRFTGIFLKAWGSFKITEKDGAPTGITPDVLVVRLDEDLGNPKMIAALWCRTVEDYEPLNVELVIKGRL